MVNPRGRTGENHRIPHGPTPGGTKWGTRWGTGAGCTATTWRTQGRPPGRTRGFIFYFLFLFFIFSFPPVALSPHRIPGGPGLTPGGRTGFPGGLQGFPGGRPGFSRGFPGVFRDGDGRGRGMEDPGRGRGEAGERPGVGFLNKRSAKMDKSGEIRSKTPIFEPVFTGLTPGSPGGSVESRKSSPGSPGSSPRRLPGVSARPPPRFLRAARMSSTGTSPRGAWGEHPPPPSWATGPCIGAPGSSGYPR
jgi:hypothetical protein